MATSAWTYRQSTNLTSSAGDRDAHAALRNKLAKARQQRTGFYRRLAESGARAQADDDGREVEVDAEMSTTRQRRRLDTSSPHLDVVSSVSAAQSSLEELPQPRSSWRYYTSYDNGEWRRHATPIHKPEAEHDVGVSGKLAERRSASMTAGLTTHDDIVEVEDGEDGSSHSRTASALGRQQRLRGTACLTRHLSAAAASSATDSDPATLEEVKTVMKGVFDRSRYGSSSDVSELVQKILGERLRNRDQSPPKSEERVIYANPDRRTILDNVTQQLRPTLPEIPEGSDEKDFVEKTLEPSGRRWTSSPSADSERIVVVQTLFDDDYFDGGLRYEEIGAGARVCSPSLENQRDSSCRSLSNVPDTLNGEGGDAGEAEVRWTGGLPAGGRAVVTSETTRHRETRTVRETPPPTTTTSTTTSHADAFGRRIPADAVEIKVQVQRGDSDGNKEHPSPSESRLRGERDLDAAEQGQRSNTSPTSRHRTFIGDGAVETDEKLEDSRGNVLRHEKYSDQVDDVGVTLRTSSGDGRTRVTSTKSSGKTLTDDDRIWIPVIHVSGASASKSETTKSAVCPVETETRRHEVASPLADSRRGQVGTSSPSVVVNVADARQQDRSDTAEFREAAKGTEDFAEVAGSAHQSEVTSLRTGSGVGSYGFRSSIVVDRGSARGAQPVVSQMSSSRSSSAMQQSAGDGEWVIEKAL